jgi:hypothetical protein
MTGAVTRTDKRRHERVPSATPVKLRWHGTSGEAHFARGKILNTSISGLYIELAEPVKPLSYVTLDAPGVKTADWGVNGTVRHCKLQGCKYFVGVELKTGGKWD